LDDFAVRLIEAFAEEVGKFLGALESYGDNIAKYLLADEQNSRPESRAANQALAKRWQEDIKPMVAAALEDESGCAEAAKGLNARLDVVTRDATDGNGFYDILARLGYDSPEVTSARAYFADVVDKIVAQAGI
jgi:hypothetical protein